MKQRFYFKNGGSLVINEEGYEIATESGYLTKLNKDGELISKEKLEEPNLGFEHFWAMNKENLLHIKIWSSCYIPGLSDNEKRFLRHVDKALENLKDTYYIAAIEPSIDRMGNL